MPGGSLKNYVGAYEGGFKGGLPEGQGKFTEAKGRKIFEVNLQGVPKKRTFRMLLEPSPSPSPQVMSMVKFSYGAKFYH